MLIADADNHCVRRLALGDDDSCMRSAVIYRALIHHGLQCVRCLIAKTNLVTAFFGIAPDHVSILCGRADGSAGKADGAASEAAFRCPSGLARHASTQRRGNVFVADTGNHCIRALVMAADMKSGARFGGSLLLL